MAWCQTGFTLSLEPIVTQFTASPCLHALTHWGWDKMANIFQTTFSNAFSWMKTYEFLLKFHWSLFLRVQLTKFQQWFRKWLGADQATSHYMDQWWLVYWRIYAPLSLIELRYPLQNRCFKFPHLCWILPASLNILKFRKFYSVNGWKYPFNFFWW